MAYKYKLVKEIESDVLKRIGQFIKSVTIQPGDIPLEAIRKIFTQIPANNDETETLDFGIRDLLLNDGNFSEDEVEEYMDFLYQERKSSVTSGGVPINEKEKDFMDIASEKAQKGNSDRNFKQEEKNKALGNTYMSSEEHEKRKKQGKKNLTQEVLRRLRNR
jgi:hypothetical protein